MDNKNIKRINDFPLNEGILSSIGSAVGSILSGKKSKLNNILKKIKDAREEDVKHTEKIEKGIFLIQGEDTPEARFKITNLNRQRRTYSSIKNQEIDSLIKSAEKLISDDPKLFSFFHYELSEIQKETTDKMIKSLKNYKSDSDLDKLSKEFDDLIKDTDTKKNFHSYIGSREYVSDDFYNSPKNIDKEVISFVDLSSKESKLLAKDLSEDKIESYRSQLESWRFNLEIEYDKALSQLRKDIKNAKESGNNWIIPSLEKEEASIKYTMRKPIEKIRLKSSILEMEIKNRMS